MKEYVLLIHSVKLALQQRYDKKEEYMNALIDVEAKTASLAKPSSKMLAQLTKEDKTATKQVCVILTFLTFFNDSYVCSFMMIISRRVH